MCHHRGSAAAGHAATNDDDSMLWLTPLLTPCLATKRKHEEGSLLPRGSGRGVQRWWAKGPGLPISTGSPWHSSWSNRFLMHRNIFFPHLKLIFIPLSPPPHKSCNFKIHLNNTETKAFQCPLEGGGLGILGLRAF